MSGLLESTLGAVGAAGEAMDKVTGGRALRGALAGKPRELASFVPFSDSMGLTNAKDATSGRDLTDAYGITNKGDTSFGSHAAGFLADTVASPLSLIGGYGAFKAAPTLARGVVAGGKALTGLDAFEHAAGAAKGLASKTGKFLGGEAGAANFRLPPKPVDVGSLHAESLAANATRPRRWSEIPAERAYYAGDRNRRYAQRMTGREIPRDSGPSGVPSFGLGHFLGDERGSLDMGVFSARKPAIPTQPAKIPAFDETAWDLGREGFEGHKEVRRYLDNSTVAPGTDAAALGAKMRAATSAAHDYISGSGNINGKLRRVERNGKDFNSEIDRLRSQHNPAAINDLISEGGFIHTDQSIPGLMDLLEHSKLPSDMSLYRGVNGLGIKRIEKTLGVPLNSPEAVGKEFMDPGFLSTSHEKNVADAFAELLANGTDEHSGATFHFPQVPKGKQGIMMNPKEAEVLFPPGRRIRIDDNSNYPNIQATLYSSILAAMAAGATVPRMGANNGGA